MSVNDTVSQINIKKRNAEMMAAMLIHEALANNSEAQLNLSAKNEIEKAMSGLIETHIEMYEMLTELLDYVDDSYDSVFIRIKELLAKARGEQC